MTTALMAARFRHLGGMALVALVALVLATTAATAQQAQSVSLRNDSVSIRLIDVDIRTAAQALGRYLDKPLIIGTINGTARVTLDTPRPVPQADVPRMLRGLLES